MTIGFHRGAQDKTDIAPAPYIINFYVRVLLLSQEFPFGQIVL